MNIYFYDNFSSSYNRFGNRVAKSILKKENSHNIFYIHDNFDNGEIKLDGILKDKIVIINKKDIKKYIKKFNPDLFISFSFRIPDVYWTYYFNKRATKTIQVQHGLYVEDYPRKVIFILDEFKRIISYLNYLLKLLLRVKYKKNTAILLVKKDLKFVTTKNCEIDSGILSDLVIVWGEYWEKWFKDYLCYNESTQFEICGSFDSSLLYDSNKIIDTHKNSLTYICQTLVEDGRVEKKYFETFIKQLSEVTDEFKGKVFIKLHPRSNKKLYNLLRGKRNVIFTDKFPYSEFYIGHSSTLLSLCSFLKKKLLLVEFPDHNIPAIFRSMSNSIISYSDDIKLDEIKLSNFKNTEYYCEFRSNPFDKIANIIIK